MAMTRSQIMSRIRGKDTKGEFEVRRKLMAAGLTGYRLQWGEWRIDVAFPGAKVAVFYDSCFWHRCPVHAKMPKTNVEFWKRKFERGIERKTKVDLALKEAGWTVIRIWGHDLKEWEPMSVPELADLKSKKEKRKNATS